MAESVKLALRHGEGLVLACCEEKSNGETHWSDRLYSTLYACPQCSISFEELEPRTFSFNSPYGACPTCEGLGVRVAFDPELVLPDRSLSLANGAVVPGAAPAARSAESKGHFREFLDHRLRWNTPLEIPAKAFQPFLQGNGKKFRGLLTLLEKEYATTVESEPAAAAGGLSRPVVCPACGGAGCGPKPGRCALAGRAIHEITALTVAAGRGGLPRGSSSPATTSPSAALSKAKSARGWSSSTGWAWTTSRWIAPPTRSAAANCNACGWPRGSARDWSACATCSTSPRSACIPATTSG